jgi:hypothetical protein
VRAQKRKGFRGFCVRRFLAEAPEESFADRTVSKFYALPTV